MIFAIGHDKCKNGYQHKTKKNYIRSVHLYLSRFGGIM